MRGVKNDHEFVMIRDNKTSSPGSEQEVLLINQYNYLDLNKANCQTGISFNLEEVSHLCGKTRIWLRILGVTELDSTTSIQMTEQITHLNKLFEEAT